MRRSVQAIRVGAAVAHLDFGLFSDRDSDLVGGLADQFVTVSHDENAAILPTRTDVGKNHGLAASGRQNGKR